MIDRQAADRMRVSRSRKSPRAMMCNPLYETGQTAEVSARLCVCVCVQYVGKYEAATSSYFSEVSEVEVFTVHPRPVGPGPDPGPVRVRVYILNEQPGPGRVRIYYFGSRVCLTL